MSLQEASDSPQASWGLPRQGTSSQTRSECPVPADTLFAPITNEQLVQDISYFLNCSTLHLVIGWAHRGLRPHVSGSELEVDRVRRVGDICSNNSPRTLGISLSFRVN